MSMSDKDKIDFVRMLDAASDEVESVITKLNEGDATVIAQQKHVLDELVTSIAYADLSEGRKQAILLKVKEALTCLRDIAERMVTRP